MDDRSTFPVTSLLNPTFTYVPPTRQDADGVLSRWRRLRESQRQAQANVTQIDAEKGARAKLARSNAR
jgi:alcohol dehydrogenase YqhD (iron-dependent ADH family)